MRPTGRYITCDTKTKKYANGKTGSWTYLGVWDSENVKKKIWVKEETVIQQVEKALHTLNFEPEDFTRIEKELLDNEEMQFKHFNRSIEDLNNEKLKIDKKLSALSDMLLEELLDRDEYKKKRAELILNKKEVESRIEDILHEKAQFSRNILNMIRSASTAGTRFKYAEKPKKREILEQFFERLELKGQELRYVIRSPYDGFVKNYKIM